MSTRTLGRDGDDELLDPRTLARPGPSVPQGQRRRSDSGRLDPADRGTAGTRKMRRRRYEGATEDLRDSGAAEVFERPVETGAWIRSEDDAKGRAFRNRDRIGLRREVRQVVRPCETRGERANGNRTGENEASYLSVHARCTSVVFWRRSEAAQGVE